MKRLRIVSHFFDEKYNIDAIRKNLMLIKKYRNSVVHHYGDDQIKHALYALSQPAIKNYTDLMAEIFKKYLTKEIDLSLLPLSFNPKPDIDFFNRNSDEENNPFIKELLSNMESIEDSDKSQFIINYSVKIERAPQYKIR